MTRFLLDTNIASYILKGTYPAIREHLVRIPLDRICVSAVTEGELRYGLAKRPDASRLAMLVEEFLVRVDVLPWDSAAAQSYGKLRWQLEVGGTPMGTLDSMIAAHALAVGATLVTNDRAFARVEKLKVVDWSKG